MDAVTHLIAAMRDRPDRIASALWGWLQRYGFATDQLVACLGCEPSTLERLALVPLPRPGADWEDDVEIIEISLHLRPRALRALLQEMQEPHAREYGA
jgi:hypothetical protein